MVKYSMKVKSKVHPIVVARGRLLMRNPRAVGYYVRLWVRSLTPATPHIPRLILLTVSVLRYLSRLQWCVSPRFASSRYAS